MDPEAIRSTVATLREQIGRVVIGQERVTDLLLTAMLAGGHILLEGPPGTAKTLLARTFSASLALDFNRIQFTPDLMPGDVVGTNLFDFRTNEFSLTRGPIFTQLLLADEINRTPPKTQAALLEAMQERHVTIDGKTHDLGEWFTVVATQNPIEQEGTYPLPEAQLDRFLFKVEVTYPDRDAEREMVRTHGHRSASPDLAMFDLERVARVDFLDAARGVVAAVRLADELVDYIVDLVRTTRSHATLLCGASPRSANMLATAARATAVLAGRDFVIPDDVKGLAEYVLGHRVVLAPGAEIEGHTTSGIIGQIIDSVAAPR